MIKVTFDAENPKIRQGFRILLCALIVQGIIFVVVQGGVWIYTPFNLLSGILLVGGSLGNLVYQIVESESNRKAEQYADALAEKFEKKLEAKFKEKNESNRSNNESDGTNG